MVWLTKTHWISEDWNDSDRLPANRLVLELNDRHLKSSMSRAPL
jgi:hypothetical protein